MTKWTLKSVSVGAALLVLGFGSGVLAAKTKEITRTPPDAIKWNPMDPNDKEGKGPAVYPLFGDMSGKKKIPTAFLFHTPAGFKPGPHTHTSDYYSVVVKGSFHDFAAGASDEGAAIGPGGTYFQPGKMAHDNHCDDGSDCTTLVYMQNGFDFKPAKAAKDME